MARLFLVFGVLAFFPLAYSTTTVNLYFNFTVDPYRTNFIDLRRVLIRNWPPLYVFTHPALAVRRPQFQGMPDRLILCHMNGDRPQDKCIVGFADDDLYAFGFANASGNWHCLEAFPFMPDCRMLTFGENYAQILGDGGHLNLPLVPLGRESAKQGVQMLASFSAGANEAPAKQGLARFIVMFAEGSRFLPISQRLADHWEEETHLLPIEAKYCVNWGRMSFLLLEWDKRTGRTEWRRNHERDAQLLQDECGIRWATDALAIIDLLLRPKNFVLPN